MSFRVPATEALALVRCPVDNIDAGWAQPLAPWLAPTGPACDYITSNDRCPRCVHAKCRSTCCTVHEVQTIVDGLCACRWTCC